MEIKRSAEDYLEMILMLTQEKGYARSIDVAAELNVTKPSVSHAVKRLRENGYLTMDADNSLHLTESGREIAERMYQRHQLLTRFLTALGVDETTAREDACKMEHDLSDESFAAICKHAEERGLA
ncbi:MAG: metal-dependent transcriptional regulator [Firmicutes bacterium]|nr:metal-dependent transcriptional regulator [Bacillota bacterium]